MLKFLLPAVMAMMCLTSSWAEEASDIPATVAVPTFAVSVNVIDIILNDEHRDGVDWGAIVSDFHTLSLKKDNNLMWADKKYRLSVGVVNDADYGVLLDALDTAGRVSPYTQPQQTFSADQPVTITVPDAKVVLELTLKNSREDEILVGMIPRYELTSIDAKKPGKPPSVLSLKAQVDQKLTVGHAIVLGGVFEEEEITKTHKVPLLGDIPLVGLVFRSQGRLMQKTEKIIFISIDRIS